MTRKFAFGIVLGCLMAASAFATPLQITSTANSVINFDGTGNFGFVPGNGVDSFVFTLGGCVGCTGHIDGVFTIGAINGSSAAVSGVGDLTLTDLNAIQLTGKAAFTGLAAISFPAEFGGGSVAGVRGTLLATDLAYAGIDPSLLALLNGGNISISFQSLGSLSPAYLAANEFSSSFSGVINPVPEPGTYALMGFGLMGLAYIRRRQSSR
ncbi:MAG: PEP-CTERM sorting domain-containing protein [Bryobacteraceae bacterium]|nr:PEP-CTERM sorting domain-containing protein [Bryobacteraceae bacterium]MCO5351342.1 PEP-CTERM sorting domain-containing protein [Bryobacteraceae bacterium]